jgi:glutamyl-Q tRNA(Asp) synthetase
LKKRKLSLPEAIYRGRFAPSPTGSLHFGSLIAAVGSYLDAKHNRGIWLVRMEDLDTPRCVPGVADEILRTLDTFGLHSDEPVIYQSRRTVAYEEALHKLQADGKVYPCCCTRKEIADSALNGIEGPVYPGTCRDGIPANRAGRAWRVRTNSPPFDELRANELMIEFDDALQGRISQNLEKEIGDFVVKRADGLFAYQLAVVVDDAFQNITHIVRGADLLASTPRQIYLQRLLGYPTPTYMHIPVAVNDAGEKLSKQTLAAPADTSRPAAGLVRVLNFLQQRLPAGLDKCDVKTVLDWAIQNWDAGKLRGIRTRNAQASHI